MIFGKNILKRGQMSWNWCQLLGKHDFWAKICSRAKIDRGGSRSPPRSWQGLSDVSLIRVINYAPCKWSYFERAKPIFKVPLHCKWMHPRCIQSAVKSCSRIRLHLSAASIAVNYVCIHSATWVLPKCSKKLQYYENCNF